jgi:hypothetical protein
MKDRALAAASVVVLGVAIVALGLTLANVTIDREFVGVFILVPLGMVIIAASVWSMVNRHLS